MNEYLVCYDLGEARPDPHKKFLEIADKEGWFTIGIDGVSIEPVALPNTTISKSFANMAGAIEGLKRVARATRAAGYTVVLTRVAIVEIKEERYWDNGDFKF